MEKHEKRMEEAKARLTANHKQMRDAFDERLGAIGRPL